MAALLSWPPNSSSLTFTYSPEPLIITNKDATLQRTLPEVVKDCSPPCNLNPLLFNGHLQTMWTAYKYPGPQVHYKRRVVASNDDNFKGHFTIDIVTLPPPSAGTSVDGGKEDKGLRDEPTGIGHHRLPPRTTYFTNDEWSDLSASDSKPLLIALHGLSGGSYEVYLRHVLEPLVRETEAGKAAGGISGGDWEAMVVNSRGCAGSRITTSILYNARATWDVRQAVKWARKTWPNRPIFGIGFSLGANILANYLGEEGEGCLLNGALLVGNPWKLEISNAALQRTLIGRNLYSKTMGNSMRALYDTHVEQISANKALDGDRIRQVKHLYEFDREVQCATWGYPTEGAYYRDASSADSVLAIRIPTLCLHAVDDPIAADEAVPYEEIRQNPFVVMCATSGGGHLSWFEWGGSRWHAKPTVNFLNAIKNIDPSKTQVPQPPAKGPRGGHKTPFIFEPMRRKAHWVGSDQ